ncbi:MAG: thiamine biosynthesis protein ThiS [Bacteroidetes bacterium]|nr:MAG: thiamine biosynthesis protein ThiS [Bacteroidota bacterium]
MVEIKVNDEARQVPEGTSISQLVEILGLRGKGAISIAVNSTIVRAGSWDSHVLEAQDQVIILTIAQGG